jgi:hypothetical protein
MNYLMAQVADQTRSQGRLLPSVVILVLKYDYCAHRSEEELQKQITRHFEPLFTDDSAWVVTICYVSLGAGLAGDKLTGEIKPMDHAQLHVPVVFAIHRFFHEKSETIAQRMAQLRHQHLERQKTQAVVRQEAERLGGNVVRDVWNRNKINEKLVEAEQADAEMRAQIGRLALSEQDRDAVEAKLKLLFRELTDLAVFYSGEWYGLV